VDDATRHADLLINTGLALLPWTLARRGAWILADMGRYADALRDLEQALDLLETWAEGAPRQRVNLYLEARVLADLATARLAVGNATGGLAAARASVDAGRRRRTPVLECYGHLALAGREAVHATLTDAEDLISATGAHGLRPFLHTAHAELARLAGDEAGCRREARTAKRLFTEMGSPRRGERLVRNLTS
jgi:hypothetical protein